MSFWIFVLVFSGGVVVRLVSAERGREGVLFLRSRPEEKVPNECFSKNNQT